MDNHIFKHQKTTITSTDVLSVLTTLCMWAYMFLSLSHHIMRWYVFGVLMLCFVALSVSNHYKTDSNMTRIVNSLGLFFGGMFLVMSLSVS